MSTENFYATTAGGAGGGAGTAEKFDYDVISSKRSAINGFLNDALTGTAALNLEEVLNDATLNVIVDALAEILHTTLVYEALPVAYSFGQTNIPADLYFLVANSLTKEELRFCVSKTVFFEYRVILVECATNTQEL